MNIAILTSPEQWYIPKAVELTRRLSKATLFFRHEDVGDEYDIVFILSYHRIIPKDDLNKHKHNIVIHASSLPRGKGWAPLFWQVLEGSNCIPFTMFEATEKMDDGDVYMQRSLKLTGYELNDELRELQADMIQSMCIEFVEHYDLYQKPSKQTGLESIYFKRTAKDSQLDVDKTLREQFNLLRIVSNDDYPAFFELGGHRYVLKIEKQETVDERMERGGL